MYLLLYLLNFAEKIKMYAPRARQRTHSALLPDERTHDSVCAHVSLRVVSHTELGWYVLCIVY